MKRFDWATILSALVIIVLVLAGCAGIGRQAIDATDYFNRGWIDAKQGQYEDAVADCNKATEINPKYDEAYNTKAWLLATCEIARYRDGNKAVELAQKAVGLSPISDYLDTLAAAYAEAGIFEDAIINQEKVIAQLKKEDKAKTLSMNL